MSPIFRHIFRAKLTKTTYHSVQSLLIIPWWDQTQVPWQPLGLEVFHRIACCLWRGPMTFWANPPPPRRRGALRKVQCDGKCTMPGVRRRLETPNSTGLPWPWQGQGYPVLLQLVVSYSLLQVMDGHILDVQDVAVHDLMEQRPGCPRQFCLGPSPGRSDNQIVPEKATDCALRIALLHQEKGFEAFFSLAITAYSLLLAAEKVSGFEHICGPFPALCRKRCFWSGPHNSAVPEPPCSGSANSELRWIFEVRGAFLASRRCEQGPAKRPRKSDKSRGSMKLPWLIPLALMAVRVSGDESCNDLWHAAEGGDTEEVEHLLRHGIDVDCRGGPNDGTALGAASLKGQLETAELLLKHGATVDAKDKGGVTPLHVAAYNGHLKVAKLLMKHSANVDAKDSDGETPLHFAADNGHVQVAKLLISNGANVDAKNKGGLMPLHVAAYNGHLKVVKLLMKHSANVDVKDNDGETPLHRAAYNGHLQMVELLVSQGASVDVKNNDGYRPLHIAAYNGHLWVMKVLISHGASIAVKDNDGETPLHSAAESSHVQAAKLLLEHGSSIQAFMGKGIS
eukprot:s739_g26.t1